MRKQVIVCGDSFNSGVGCPDITTQFYGVLVANALDMDLVTLARGSASNYTIYLQAKYVVDNPQEFNPGLVLIGTTSTDRLEWVSENQRKSNNTLTANQINYHEYSPYHGYLGKVPNFYFQDKPNYDPRLLSEQMPAIEDFFNVLKSGYDDGGYYKRLRTEPRAKLQTILDYCVNVLDENIKFNYDMSAIFTAYSFLNRKSIRTIILTDKYFIQCGLGALVDQEDYLDIDWFEMAVDYPDKLGTRHASEEAHAIVAKMIIDRFQTS